jgi:hypothetical protein
VKQVVKRALRKIALSLKSVFLILSSYLLIRSHFMSMLALVITIVIVNTLFHPHLTSMSSTIYMHILERIERTEGEW